MSVKTSKTKEMLNRISTSLKHSIANNADIEEQQMRNAQNSTSKINHEVARNTAILMTAMRMY